MSVLISRSFLFRGIKWMQLNEFAAAAGNFEAAIRYAPDDPYAHWNRATALLSMGDYAEGFKEHDWGWKLFNWRGFGPVKDDIDRLQALPMWRSHEEGVRLLVYHELGFGDGIMVMRYLPELRRRAEVTLVIDQPLARLARTFGVEVATKVPDDLSRFDYRLPFFGVMSALKQTLGSIPAAPYILATGPVAKRSVGIAWSGRTQTMFSLERFLSLFAWDDFKLFSLQPGLTTEGVEPLYSGSDFADVADRIARMEHIVTVDTAAAHLAGAMGHPSVHLVLPFLSDWRWWHTEAWYPTVKTYRQAQTGNDWQGPFVKLNVALSHNLVATGD